MYLFPPREAFYVSCLIAAKRWLRGKHGAAVTSNQKTPQTVTESVLSTLTAGSLRLINKIKHMQMNFGGANDVIPHVYSHKMCSDRCY